MKRPQRARNLASQLYARLPLVCRMELAPGAGNAPAGWLQPKSVVELQQQGWHLRHSSKELAKRQVCLELSRTLLAAITSLCSGSLAWCSV